MISLEPRLNCPLCGSESRSTYINFNDIPVVKCDNCNFIYSSCIMSSEAINIYYTKGFGSKRHFEGQIVNAAMNENIISRLVKFNKSMSVLDVGTGYGFFLDTLKKKWAINGVGVELSTQEAEYAKNTLGLNIYNQPLVQSDITPKEFDLVCSFEVIEHIANPIAFIKELKTFLAPNGKLIIGTDNFESKVVKDLGAGWPKWIPHSHISHFGPDSFRLAFKAAGLKVESVASISPWEQLSRSLAYKIINRKISEKDGFNLEKELNTEMNGEYKMFNLRKRVNPLWAKWFLRRDLEGAMMYIVASRI